MTKSINASLDRVPISLTKSLNDPLLGLRKIQPEVKVLLKLELNTLLPKAKMLPDLKLNDLQIEFKVLFKMEINALQLGAGVLLELELNAFWPKAKVLLELELKAFRPKAKVLLELELNTFLPRAEILLELKFNAPRSRAWMILKLESLETLSSAACHLLDQRIYKLSNFKFKDFPIKDLELNYLRARKVVNLVVKSSMIQKLECLYQKVENPSNLCPKLL